MKKLLLFAMAAILLVPFSAKAQVAADELPSGYCTVNTKYPNWESSYTHAVQSFTVTVNGEEVMNVPNVTSTFNNLTSTNVFDAEQGSEVIVKIVNGTWTTNVWLGFDWDRDGAFDDVYQAYDENRVGGTNDEYSFVVTVPADADLGKSMVRLYSDGIIEDDVWNITSPMCGTQGDGKIGYCGSVHNFTINVLQGATSDVTYSVAVSSADETMGTAEASATEALENTRVTLTATANSGYKFSAWTVDGEVVSTANPYSAKITADTEFVANFRALEVYNVAVSVNDAIMGTAVSTAEGSVYEGTQITLTATAADGYVFENWTVDGTEVSTNATFTTTVSASTEYVANFSEVPTKLNLVGVSTSFSMNSSYYPIENLIDGDRNTEVYYDIYDGESVTVELEQESTIGDIVLVFYNYGYYQPDKAKIQVSIDNETYVDVEGCSFVKSDIVGGVVTLKAKGTSAKYVRLVFEETYYLDMYEFEVYESPVKVSSRAISVSVNDDTMGTAYIGTEGITSVEDQTTAVRLYAVANEGYEFVNWTLNGEVVSTVATVIDKTEGDKEYVANFKASAVYNVTVSANNSKMGTVEATKTGQIFNGTEITLTATPNEGYEFLNWTVGETVVSKDAIFTVKVVEDVAYVANFRMKLAKINLAGVEAEAFGSVYDIENVIDGSYTSYSALYQREGASVIVELPEEMPIGEVKLYFYISSYYSMGTAKLLVSSDKTLWTDIEGSQFGNDDLVYNSESGLSVITIDTKDAVAKYVKMTLVEPQVYMYMYEFEVYEATVNVAPRTISVSVNDDTMGTAYVGAAGTTIVEEETGAVKLVAEVSSNAYRFVNWTVDGEVVSTNKTIVDRTEGDKAYVANFEAKPIYTITAVSSNDELGTVESTAGEVIYEGDAITFTATAADGYMFTAWTVGKDTVSVSNPYSITATADLALVANFDRDPLLDRSNWTITASSEETTGEGTNGFATCIIDGKQGTFWHSQWEGSEPGYPHWFMIDMKESKAFDAFEYVSRGAGTSDAGENNGNILNYELYTSNTEIDPNALENATLVTSGQFTYDGTSRVHRVEFNSVKGQYVMLYATGQSANGKKNASCAEFYLYSNNFAVSVASSNPEIGSVYIGEEGITSVGCSVEGTDVVTLTAVPADKFQFVNWTLDGEVVSTDAVYTTDLITESRAYVANFEFAPVAPRTITAAVNNAAKGSVVFLAPESTEASVVSDNIVVLEAIPATTDDFFVNWTINGTEVGTEATYEYLEAEATTIQANFISKYIVTVQPNDNGKVTIKQGGSSISSGDRVLEGDEIEITVKANERKELKELYVNGVNVFAQYKAAGYVYKTTVTEGITISTVYGDPICYFTYSCTGNGWIEAYESDTYDEVAEEEGTLELPVSPDGYQYAYGEEVPFTSTLAIFPVAGAGDKLISISVNGEELEVSEESEIIYYGDHFISEVISPIHVVAVFSGVSTGVESAEVSETSIYAVAGGIVVEVAETATASIYSIAGVLVSEQTVSEKATIAMEKGVYIVKVADKVAKVIVK